MGFDVEAFLGGHFGTLSVAVAALAGCFLALVRAYERARALGEAARSVSLARALLEQRGGRPGSLLPRLGALEARLRRLAGGA